MRTAPNPMAIQVLIVSDQPILRKGLGTLLENAHVHVIGEAADSREALRLARICHPDVAILDSCGTSLNDPAFVQGILQASAVTKIILLTARGEDQDVLPALQAGVSGYVLKADAADLTEAIQEVSRGMTYLSRSVSSVVVKAYLTQAQPDTEHSGKPGSPDHPSRVGEPAPAETTSTSPAATGQRRLTAIMFTDMVGYSALTRKSEPLALELVEQHNGLLRQRLVEHGGREIKAMGDGFMVVFASALDAVRCAAAIQKAVHERNAVVPPGKAFQVRIGVHAGDVVHRGDDVLGDGVNIASRIECLAKPGGICISEQVVNLIRHAIGHPLIKLGKAALKNIPTPVRVYYVGLPWAERPVSFRDRMSFACFHRRKTLSLADLINAAFVVTVAGLVLWQSIAEHKAMHAMVWFGESTPPDTRLHEAPLIAPLSLTGTAPTLPRSLGVAPGAGATPVLEQRFPAAEQRAGLMQATQAPDLLALMVKRDSGATFHFARQYDRIRDQLRRSSESSPPVPPDPIRSMHASREQAMFEEVFAWTMRPVTASTSEEIR